MKVENQADLERILKRYRKRLGIDSTYMIYIEIIPENKVKKGYQDADAWLIVDPTHPIFNIKVRKGCIERYQAKPRCIVRVIVHELLHIIVGEAFKDLKKNYNYDKDGMIEETLVMRLAKAIVPLGDEEFYNQVDG